MEDVPMTRDETVEVSLSTWGSGTAPSRAALAGGVVLKPGGPWAPAVLALLRHLEDVGFEAAPKAVGDGYAADGRMTLTYVPGESAHPSAWREDDVGRVGELLRELHEATRSFCPPPSAAWQSTWLHDVGDSGELVVGHGDAAPWNIVGPNASVEALIDWDFAGPVNRISELAYAVWLNAQLHDDDVAELQGLPDAGTRARHARLILDGYGLDRSRRSELVERMIEVAVHAARAEAVRAGVHPDSSQAIDNDGYPILWAITWRARSASWMIRNRSLLLASVC
ncbi:MAG TPA: phosphotransferase [Nocardioidaceae bacterium]|nr:phosphotransferase [Nocardioidaceae bacterium]